MAQIFRPRANTIVRIVLIGLLLLPFLAIGIGMAYVRSPYLTLQEVPLAQPVPFSHQHHVGGLGIDCRYCHITVEFTEFAGLPATEVCMTCHSQLWTQAQLLEPVRDSLRDGIPIRWNRVHDLPDFVYFNHSAHVNNGVGCVSCHGRVDQMPLTWKAESLQMSWCLDCHRNPGPRLRPPEYIYDLDWRPPRNRQILAEQLLEFYGVHVGQLTDCSICHR